MSRLMSNEHPVRTDTLPRSSAAPARGRRTAVLALLGSLVLLVGVPVGLVLAVGNPLPTELPSRSWLTADLTTGLVIDVLALLVWVVWVHFVVCFLTEWRAIRAGRVPEKVAFGGGSQTLARQLVAGILLLSGGASVAQGASALAADPVEQPRTSPSVVQTVEREVVVDASRHAARGDQADRTDRTDRAEQALKHWEVRPPEGRNHDTLWDIAERTLGDPFRYKEIFALNKDRLQPDGSRLTDADLIRPGWQLRLPGDAKGPGVRTTAAPVRPAVPQPDAPARAGGAEVQETGAAHGAATDQAAPSREQDGSNGIGSLVLGGGLILAGVARALTARRGPFGEPDPAAVDLARGAAMRRAELLDHGLRGLAESRRAAGLPMPELLFAFVDDSQLVIHLAQVAPAPERPWTASEDGLAWTLHADELVPAGAGAPAPYPSLVNVADAHGFDLMVDLEMAPGLVALGGDLGVAREVVMSMALDLATHAWSDSVTVVLAGFGNELADLAGAGVHHVAHLDEAIAVARQGRDRVGRVAAELGVHGVLQGRQRGTTDDCAPVVVFASGAPTSEQAQQLAELTAGGRTNVSVVCVGDSPSARWRFVVDSAGALDTGVLGVRGTARRLTGQGQERVHTLLEEAVRRRVEGAFEQAASTPAAVVESVAVAPATAPSPVRVQLLGPVAVEAPGHVDPTRRDQLTEVVVMAALHPDGLHEAVLSASLWPRGAERDVVAARLADAQEWLGHDADGRPRLTLDADGRWHLADVVTDYARLAEAAAHTGPGELDALLAALRLGTGAAFSGPGDRFTWLVFAREARTCRMLVTSVARRAADLAVGAGHPARAEEALELGLRLVPTAEVLWRDRLRLLSRHAPEQVQPVLTQMYSVLDQHGARHEPETDALVAELAPGLGGAVGG
jgi:hypothetical protein